MIGLFALAAAAASDPLAAQAMQNLGTCIVAFTPKGAREVLEMDYNTPAYRQRLHRLLDGHQRCVPGSSIGSQQLLFAGSIAEALIRAEVKSKQLASRLEVQPGQGMIVARSPTEAMALCTVVAAPQQSSVLLSTEAGSAQEQAALAPLIPFMTNCSPTGLHLTANRSSLRALIALAAWRVASAPRSAAQ
ncbi:MAG TPA: hypothetical protein VJR87_12340 [Allosphingosinicella sp.]|nr:hypothetical protein [Allosphingosinicella sp.]